MALLQLLLLEAAAVAAAGAYACVTRLHLLRIQRVLDLSRIAKLPAR